MERDEYTCQKCGATGEVHVHHRRKIALFYVHKEDRIDYDKANDLDNLITLCPTCHKAADGHAKLRGFTYLQ